MDDKELREQLSRSPLVRNGFDEELRRRIHEEIDNPGKRRTKLWMMPWARLGAVFTMLIAVLAGLWIWQSQSDGSSAMLSTQAEQTGDIETDDSTASVFTKDKPRSAILIGLRKDIPAGEEGGPASTYRTLLVAPEENELAVEASGAGIWMPYKMNFMHIDAVPDSIGKGMQTIAAISAGEPLPDSIAALTNLRRTEKLLYAGNKYISVQQTTSIAGSGQSVNQTDVWVKDVDQMSPASRTWDISISNERSYKLSQLVPTAAPGDDFDQWTISRVAGHWAVTIPVRLSKESNSNDDAADVEDWLQLDTTLPKEVVSYDKLNLSWDEIYERDPSAEDAFTSPTDDLLAVKSNDAIKIYAYRMKEEDMKPLTIELEDNESIVMVQWAQDGYVDNWKQMLGQWIGTTNHN